MAQTVCPLTTAEDRQRLAAILADRNRPQKHVARARIILASAERLEVAAIARRAGISRPVVWRWQQRFAEAGVDGLLHDKTRKPGKPPTAEAVAQRVVALTCAEPPGETTHWTGRMMAEATGLSLRTVQRIWAAHKLQPHRLRSFKRAVIPSSSPSSLISSGYTGSTAACGGALGRRKSQIQALDRTQPGLPLKPGKAGTMTHDYVRQAPPPCSPRSTCWTAPCSAAAWQRHRHQEFVRFLNAVEAAVPAASWSTHPRQLRHA